MIPGDGAGQLIIIDFSQQTLPANEKIQPPIVNNYTCIGLSKGCINNIESILLFYYIGDLFMKRINKTSLIASAISLTLASALALAGTPGYLSINDVQSEVEGKGVNKTVEVEIKTNGAIPVDGKSGAFGYAVLTDNSNNVLVLVTHLPIDDSSYEHPTSGFHAHVLDLKEPTDACKSANFEVDLVNSAKNTAFDANYPWKVKGQEIAVKKVPVTDLGDAGVETVVSFTLQPVLDANKKPTNLCITVVDKI